MGYRKLSVDLDEAARLYRDEGLSLEQVAIRLGCGRDAIRLHLAEAGVSRRPRGRRRDPAVEAEAARLYAGGLDIDEVSRAVGRGRATVHRWIVDAGVPRRRRGGRPACAPIAEIEAAYLGGEEDVAAIAARLGCTRSNLYARLKRRGTPMRGRWGRVAQAAS